MNRVHSAADDLPELNQGIWRRRGLGQHSYGGEDAELSLCGMDSDHPLRTAAAVCATDMASAAGDLGTGHRSWYADTTARVRSLLWRVRLDCLGPNAESVTDFNR